MTLFGKKVIQIETGGHQTIYALTEEGEIYSYYGYKWAGNESPKWQKLPAIMPETTTKEG